MLHPETVILSNTVLISFSGRQFCSLGIGLHTPAVKVSYPLSDLRSDSSFLYSRFPLNTGKSYRLVRVLKTFNYTASFSFQRQPAGSSML